MSMLAGIGDDAPRTLDPEAKKNLVGNDFRCQPILGVLDDRVSEDSSADDNPLP